MVESPLVKLFKRLILAGGVLTLAGLLWKFDPKLVWGELSSFGWGFLLVIPFQLFDHGINALGWRFAFPPEQAGRIPLWRLITARVAGDGVNYLTPSANIAGEFVRPSMLGPVASEEAKITSVILAKLTQALGQALFIIIGLLLVVQGKFDILGAKQRLIGAGTAALTGGAVLLAFWVVTHKGPLGDRFWRMASKLGPVREPLRQYVERHPVRLAFSIVFFALGFAWGALEVLLICRFLGLNLDLRTALAIEVLSNVVDSLMFMVPAKMGTQEAGKTLIFAGLGLPPRLGLAFGLIRHIRELVWAAAGFGLFALRRRNSTDLR
jgi:hypothetical protein